MNAQSLSKQHAALAALPYLEEGTIIGVGTGSTIGYFIAALAEKKHLLNIRGAVASSEETAQLLKNAHIPLWELNALDRLPLYIDGADAFNRYRQLIKGGGGALTREKILATMSDKFICIVDESKFTQNLGRFPVPLEVLPMARSFVAREIVKLGGTPSYRANCVTDNGNCILDIHHWEITHPIALEQRLNQIPGILCNGIFADRPADEILIGTPEGIQRIS
jgi:ribose 5-phosphate isomerase A